MKRREFITLVGGAAAWPVAVVAQPARRVRRIGVLMAYPEADLEGRSRLGVFKQVLGSLGWTEGRNVEFHERWAAA